MAAINCCAAVFNPVNDVISSTFEKFDFDSGEFLLICMDHSGKPAASDACKRSNRKMTFGKSVQRTDGLLQLFVDGKKLTYQRKDRLGIMGRDDTLFCSDKQWKTEFRFHGLQDMTDTGLGVPHTFSAFCKISCIGNICEKCIFTDVHKITPSQNKKRTHMSVALHWLLTL